MSGIIKPQKYFFSDDDKNLHGCSARSGIGSSATDWNLAENKSLNKFFWNYYITNGVTFDSLGRWYKELDSFQGDVIRDQSKIQDITNKS